MGNSCCQPNGPGTARRRRNQAGEPLADTLDQEIARTELVVFLSKQRAATGKLQETVRQLNAELTHISEKISPLAHSRAQLLVSIQAIDEDRKVHKSIVNGLFRRLKDLENRSTSSLGLFSTLKSSLLHDPESIELIVMQFTKFLIYFLRSERASQEAVNCMSDIESRAKEMLGEVDKVAGRLTTAGSDLLLSRISAEERVDRTDIAKAEEGLVDSLFRLYRETEIEVEITRKEVNRVSEFCYDIYEESQGIRREFPSKQSEETSLLLSATSLCSALSSCGPCESTRLRDKITAFTQLVEQAT